MVNLTPSREPTVDPVGNPIKSQNGVEQGKAHIKSQHRVEQGQAYNYTATSHTPVNLKETEEKIGKKAKDTLQESDVREGGSCVGFSVSDLISDALTWIVEHVQMAWKSCFGEEEVKTVSTLPPATVAIATSPATVAAAKLPAPPKTAKTAKTTPAKPPALRTIPPPVPTSYTAAATAPPVIIATTTTTPSPVTPATPVATPTTVATATRTTAAKTEESIDTSEGVSLASSEKAKPFDNDAFLNQLKKLNPEEDGEITINAKTCDLTEFLALFPGEVSRTKPKEAAAIFTCLSRIILKDGDEIIGQERNPDVMSTVIKGELSTNQLEIPDELKKMLAELYPLAILACHFSRKDTIPEQVDIPIASLEDATQFVREYKSQFGDDCSKIWTIPFMKQCLEEVMTSIATKRDSDLLGLD